MDLFWNLPTLFNIILCCCRMMKEGSIKFQLAWLACLLKEDRSISQEFLTLYQSIFHKSLSDSLLRKLTQLASLHTHISHLTLVWPKLWQKSLISMFWNTLFSQIMPNFRWPDWKFVKVEWNGYLLSNTVLWEKVVLVIEGNFWNSRLNAQNLQKFRDH